MARPSITFEIAHWGYYVDEILRAREAACSPTLLDSDRIRRLFLLIMAFGLCNGLCMGSYGVLAGGSALQMVYSAAKVPLLLLASFLLCLPSFYVINALFGLRDDFAESMRAVLATQAGIAVVLASFSPLTVVWYLSNGDYNQAIAFNAVQFGAASLVGQFLLRRNYQRLLARRPRHHAMMWIWLVVYAGIGIQMGWVLRPFVGSPEMECQFFRTEAWTNAYLNVWRAIWHSLT